MSAKKNKKTELPGNQQFDTYYSALFAERWDQLKVALLDKNDSTAYQNKLQKPYYLDSASILAASTLPLEDANKILDMCAAPGGKSLIIAGRMNQTASLISNERSRERKNRLVRVLDEHLDPQIRERVSVTNRDAAQWCKFEKEAYDAILLDAPCSSERHVLQDDKYLSQWTPSRIKSLSVAQWALLSSAFLSLKKNGYLLYATCALSTTENDDVIKKLLKKYANAEVIKNGIGISDALAEETEYGFHVLPDTHGGAGPLYFSLVQKH